MYRMFRGVAVPVDYQPPPPPPAARQPEDIRAKMAALRAEFAERAKARAKGGRK